MKALVCEMCGSHDMVKDNGYFVCQHCGAKYTIEEAKKMMIEGTVDVSGSTVKVDSSERLNNLYLIARRAKDENNDENAEKYYDMILVEDPTSWEASFYVVYFKAMQCKIGQIKSAAISVSNCIDSVLKLIKDYVVGVEEQDKAVKEVAWKCKTISLMLFTGAINHYNSISSQIRGNYVDELDANCFAAASIMLRLGDSIDSLFADHEILRKVAVDAWKDGIDKRQKRTLFPDKDAIIIKYVAIVQKYDKEYQPIRNETSSDGCYVATCVYGSYDCPQVWTLRRYRDFSLAKTWYGRTFIHTYYAISPFIVKWFGETEWFKKMWLGTLNRIVDNLRKEGYKDTPYEDRNWRLRK